VYDRRSIAGLIDHSLLKPDATYEDIRILCYEALHFGFYSVCVNPFFISHAREHIQDSGIKVTAVIGFPFGMTLTDVKVHEARNAAHLGADELDIVINIGAVKSRDWKTVRRDLFDVITATPGLIHKAIIETCYLLDDEKRNAAEIVLDTGAEFIKTSTGFGPKGAEVRDITLIKNIIGNAAGIKAAGGIRTLRQVIDFIETGATRIGTSAGVRIIGEIQ
jgi:deoxyribose-phosphate aldolase